MSQSIKINNLRRCVSCNGFKANQFNCHQSPMLKREVCGGDFEATIDRTAFGVNYGVDWGCNSS